MTHLNRELTAILRQTGTVLFVTALYCVFQCDQMTMRHARAGHHPPLHVRRHSGEVHFASGADEAAGPALGLFPGAPFGTTTTQLSPGDLVLLFTDGIIEAESATGSEWGSAGLKQTVRANLTAPGSALLDLLLAKAQTFTGINEFVDDVCLAAVELEDRLRVPNENKIQPPRELQKGLLPNNEARRNDRPRFAASPGYGSLLILQYSTISASKL
jgi:serine phosphatase RsbU (regulator of sigma subunit)